MATKKKNLLDPDSLPDWANSPDVVSPEEIRQKKNLKYYKDKLDKKYPNGWGDQELKEAIVEIRRRNIEAAMAGVIAIKDREKAIDDKVMERYQEYVQILPALIPNDRTKLKELCRIELGLEELDRRFNSITGNDKDAKLSDLETLSKTRKDMLSSYATLERELGIDRERRHKESDAVGIYDNVKKQAKKIIAERGEIIVCPECVKDNNIKINAGILIFHFAKNGIPYELKWECPHCHRLVSIGNAAWTIQPTL